MALDAALCISDLLYPLAGNTYYFPDNSWRRRSGKNSSVGFWGNRIPGAANFCFSLCQLGPAAHEAKEVGLLSTLPKIFYSPS